MTPADEMVISLMIIIGTIIGMTVYICTSQDDDSTSGH